MVPGTSTRTSVPEGYLPQEYLPDEIRRDVLFL